MCTKHYFLTFINLNICLNCFGLDLLYFLLIHDDEKHSPPLPRITFPFESVNQRTLKLYPNINLYFFSAIVLLEPTVPSVRLMSTSAPPTLVSTRASAWTRSMVSSVSAHLDTGEDFARKILMSV